MKQTTQGLVEALVSIRSPCGHDGDCIQVGTTDAVVYYCARCQRAQAVPRESDFASQPFVPVYAGPHAAARHTGFDVPIV